tara:strand:- start:3364 stop:3726 length:363 start_codon:yes stop_codon:yes gene_type:complete
MLSAGKATHKLAFFEQYNYIVVINKLKFDWDLAKAQSNINKHGISFDEASTVFYDELARLIPDPDSSNLEERFIILGQSKNQKLLVVCHCYRDEEQVIRIISARRADKHERKSYEVFRHA